MTVNEWNEMLDSQIGKTCIKHGTIIKQGKYGNWCGQKDDLGRWCAGYPDNEDRKEQV
jgi:hypothetical protein